MLPTKIRVKLLPEAASYITVSHVVERDFNVAQLLEVLLPVLGRDASRIRQILRAGTVSTGDYRFRWASLDLEEHELAEVLAGLPHADPSRAFEPQRAILVRFRRKNETVELRREAASRKPLFSRQSFWEALVGAFGSQVQYIDYSYSDKADVFTVEAGGEGRELLESLLRLLRPKSIAGRIERLQPEKIEWLIRR
jgi:hypothetical protein